MPDIAVSTLSRADEEILALRRENAKLRKINHALMASVERGPDLQGGAFALFQTAAALGNQVQERTAALTEALGALTRAKEEEAQAKKRLAAAIEAINQGIVLCDSQDRIVITNQRYRELWGGLSAEPGTPFVSVVRGAAARGMVACHDRSGDWEAFRIERHRNPGEPFVIEFRDGTWLQVSERRVAGGGIVSLYTDITEVKRDEARRRERELEEKSVLLQATLDNLSQGVSVFDADRQLVACNPGFHDFLRGASRNAECCTPEELSTCSVARLDSIGLGFVHSPQGNAGQALEFKTPCNRIFDIRTSLMPGGTCVSTYTDVTERLRISDALKEANEGLERRVEARTAELIRANAEILAAKAEAEMMNLSKTKFFAAANHDLLQPLAAARVFASALSERRLSPPNRELVRHALAALDSVDDMLTALLDIAKLDAGVMPPERCSFSVREVMLRVGEEYKLIAARKKLRLRVFAGDAVIESDPRLLSRILRNLVSNALRYTNGGGVLIGHRRIGRDLLVGVWDNRHRRRTRTAGRNFRGIPPPAAIRRSQRPWCRARLVDRPPRLAHARPPHGRPLFARLRQLLWHCRTPLRPARHLPQTPPPGTGWLDRPSRPARPLCAIDRRRTACAAGPQRAAHRMGHAGQRRLQRRRCARTSR